MDLPPTHPTTPPQGSPHPLLGEPMVIQRYVSRPLLLDGFKWDLRLYVLVTSFDPLEAFLYTEGFGRFASEPFSLERSRLQDPFVHLTNASIQRRHPSARRDEPNADGGDAEAPRSSSDSAMGANIFCPSSTTGSRPAHELWPFCSPALATCARTLPGVGGCVVVFARPTCEIRNSPQHRSP